MTVLKHVGVLSLAKITALFGLLFGLLCGLIWGILFAVFAAALAMIVPGTSSLGAGGIGVITVIVMAIIGAIIGAVIGLIKGAVLAFLYNVFADRVGGIQIDLA
jgi:hypothetical protein